MKAILLVALTCCAVRAEEDETLRSEAAIPWTGENGGADGAGGTLMMAAAGPAGGAPNLPAPRRIHGGPYRTVPGPSARQNAQGESESEMEGGYGCRNFFGHGCQVPCPDPAEAEERRLREREGRTQPAEIEFIGGPGLWLSSIVSARLLTRKRRRRKA